MLIMTQQYLTVVYILYVLDLEMGEDELTEETLQLLYSIDPGTSVQSTKFLHSCVCHFHKHGA